MKGFLATLARDPPPTAGASAAHIAEALRLACDGTTAEVAAVFTFGRDDDIPLMFNEILPPSGACAEGGAGELTIFRYCLERHIDLDGKDHGPLAIALVEELCGTDDSAPTRKRWQAATCAVKEALAKRTALWDAVLAAH